MNELTKEIFKVINVMPNEIFKVIGHKKYFRINENLKLFYNSKPDETDKLWTITGPYFSIADLIINPNIIKKIKKPTKEEKIAIDYARACGCNWIAKDIDGTYAYVDKPIKLKTMKVWGIKQSLHEAIPIFVPISFISWEDEEPYYIGG
jgi:hypothetical protein